MKKELASTKNLKKFTAALNDVISSPNGIDRMALIYGDPGLGKSEAALWWVNHVGRDAALIRAWQMMSPAWLLRDIVAELGENPAYRTADLARQISDILRGTDRVVLIDEVDCLTRDARVIETLRDVHDTTGSPFVFIGMEHADKKLKRFRHLRRRFSQVVRFEALDKEDIATVLNQICEVPYDESVVDMISDAGETTVAMLYRWTQRIEQIARWKKADCVTAGLFQGKQK